MTTTKTAEPTETETEEQIFGELFAELEESFAAIRAVVDQAHDRLVADRIKSLSERKSDR